MGINKLGPAGGNQGAEGFVLFPIGLIIFPTPPVWGALAVIGVSGRTWKRRQDKETDIWDKATNT